MSGSTISTSLTTGITLGTAPYASPLTITQAGTVTTGSGTTALTATIASGYVLNDGVLNGGTGLDLASGTVVNAGIVEGNEGGSGVLLESGTLINTGSGSIAGGTRSGYGADAVRMDAGTLINDGKIIGGYGNGGFGANGGAGVSVFGGDVINDGTIAGGREGDGIKEFGGSVTNNGLLMGGYGPEFALYTYRGAEGATNTGTIVGGFAGTGVYDSFGITFTNSGTVVGGRDSNGNGGLAVEVGRGGGAVFNSGVLAGGYYGAGLKVSYGLVINTGTILGGVGGGAGVIGSGVTNDGTIIGGEIGPGITAGVGVSMSRGGSLIDAGMVVGGGNGTADAVNFGTGAGALLTLDPGASFVGAVVASSSQHNELALAGAAVRGILDMGTSFSGFGTIVFDAGATWSLEGDQAELAGGETIDGFAGGDTLTLDGFVATSSIYVPGTGLELSDGTTTETLDIAGALATGAFTIAAAADATVIAVACFRAGTRIATVAGARPVETLRIGDLVLTASGVARPVRWLGHRSYDPRFVAGRRDILPITFRAGALAEGIPARDLAVSPKHAMLIDGVLVPAELLVNGVSVVQEPPGEEIAYHHVELDSHDILVAEGAPSESFVDRDSRMMFHNAPEFFDRYGQVPPQPDCAPRVEDGAILAAIRGRIAARAGLAADHAADASTHGPLDGRIDGSDRSHVAGWAFDATRPRTAIALELLVDGVPVAAGVANAFRDDLRQAGKGEGRCAFRLSLPEPLPAGSAHRLEIRRATDGAALAACALAADPPAPGPLDGRIDHCNGLTVEGWALDTTHPGTPVRLEVVAGEVVLGEVLADRHRADLARAGKADGWCSFVYRFDTKPDEPGAIRVRRVTDGATLGHPAPVPAAA